MRLSAEISTGESICAEHMPLPIKVYMHIIARQSPKALTGFCISGTIYPIFPLAYIQNGLFMSGL